MMGLFFRAAGKLPGIVVLGILSVAAGGQTTAQQEIRISAIFVHTRAKADSVRQLLEAGKPFPEIARQYSVGPGRDKGGDLGYMSIRNMAPAIAAAVIDLTRDEISEVIAVDNGFALIVKTDQKSAAEIAARQQREQEWRANAERLFDRYNAGAVDEAATLAEDNLIMAEQYFGPRHSHTATSLNDLGVIRFSRGKLAAADSLFERALAIRRETLGPAHPDVAVTLSNIAELRIVQKRPEEADSLYRRALEIARSALPKDHPDIAEYLTNLAKLHHSREEYALAESYYFHALSIRKAAHGQNHITVADLHNFLAELFRVQGKLEKAAPHYQAAYEVTRNWFGPRHRTVAEMANNLGLLKHSLGDTAAAARYFEEALLITELILGPTDPGLLPLLENIAALYEESAAPQKYEIITARIADIRRKHSDSP